MMVCCATVVGATGNGGGRTAGNGGGFAVGGGGGGGCEREGGGGGGWTKGETPGKGGGAAATAVSGNTTLGNLPSKLGSRARIRSINGGCVANPNSSLFKPFAKNKWLTSSARCDCNSEPSVAPPIFLRAPASPEGLRVNCTADASARNSRCRLTAAWIR